MRVKEVLKCQGRSFWPSRREMLTSHLFSVFHNYLYIHTVQCAITLNWTETHSPLSNIISNNLQSSPWDKHTEETSKTLRISQNVKWNKPDKPADICLSTNSSSDLQLIFNTAKALHKHNRTQTTQTFIWSVPLCHDLARVLRRERITQMLIQKWIPGCVNYVWERGGVSV